MRPTDRDANALKNVFSAIQTNTNNVFNTRNSIFHFCSWPSFKTLCPPPPQSV